MFNKVILIGNLTRNIELKYLQSGTAVGNTAIAVNRKYTGQNGEKREEVCFIDIAFFGRTAEVANQYLSKGSRVLVEGRLKLDQWTDNNGASRSKHSIIVETMHMLGSSQIQGGNSQNSYMQNSNNYPPQRQQGNQNYSQNFQPQNHQSDYENYEYQDKIQDIDVDADKYDNNDEIPF